MKPKDKKSKKPVELRLTTPQPKGKHQDLVTPFFLCLVRILLFR